ncbi:MAG: LuxR C-terminal-related transcriptional regulator [Acidimicrobiales bacterium]
MASVDGGVIDLGATAVVSDRMPLARVGMATALRLADVVTLELCDTVPAAFDAVQRSGARIYVAGVADPDELDALRRRLPGTEARVVGLVAGVDRRDLVGLLDAGIAGVALRTVLPEDLAAMVRAVFGGERAIAPALMSVLVGFEPADAVVVAPAERSPLTLKERQVLGRLAQGESNAAIAEALYISPATVKSHLASIYSKLDVRTRHEATSRAVSLGLLR